MPKIHVMSLRPGMHRGGRPNPQHASYDEGVHTAAQLRDLLHDANHTVIVGGEKLTEEHVARLEHKEAHEAGQAARQAGHAEDANPHLVHTPLHGVWLAGFNAPEKTAKAKG